MAINGTRNRKPRPMGPWVVYVCNRLARRWNVLSRCKTLDMAFRHARLHVGGRHRLACFLPWVTVDHETVFQIVGPETIRRLTPVECERLQGFPDGWTAGIADCPRYRMLGNAVCVNVAEWIARRMASQWGGPEARP